MIKSVIALFVFAVLLCVWIIDPFGMAEEIDVQSADAAPLATDDEGVAAQQVTRGVTNVGDLPSPEGAAEAVPAAAAPDTAATGVDRLAGQTEPMVPAGLAPAASGSGAGGVSTVALPLDVAMSGILTELGLSYMSVPAVDLTEVDLAATDDPVSAQLADALAGIAAVTGQDLAPEPAPLDAARALEGIVADALRAGRSDTDIEAEVNRAAREDAVAIPGVLIRADGTVDTAVLLEGMLVAARLAQGGAPEAGWSARLVTEDTVVHDVDPSDSVASLALAYYGDARHAEIIVAANSLLLGNGDRIAAGQRIVIPRF